jgi:hypothetical protein
MDAVLPVEFSDLQWHRRWWRKMLEEHEWMCLFTQYEEGEHFKTTKWLLAIGKLLNRFFVMTLLANLYLVDSGYCATIDNKEECLVTRNLDQIDTLCHWRADTGECEFYKIHPSFLPLLILVIIICIATLPLDTALEFAVMKIQHYADSRASQLHLGDHAHLEDPNLELADDDMRVKGFSVSNVLLSARVELMRTNMDKKKVEDELKVSGVVIT